MKNGWRNAIKIIVGLCLFGWLVISGRVDFSIFFSSVTLYEHLMGLSLIAMAMLIQCYRWQVLLHVQQIRLSYTGACRLTWISQFLAIFMPGGIGAELVRGYYIVRETEKNKIAGAVTVLLDRGLGLYTLLLLGMISFLYIFFRFEVVLDEIFVSGLLITGMFLAFNLFIPLSRVKKAGFLYKLCVPSRLFSWIQQAGADYRHDKVSILKGIVISIAAGVLSILAFYVAGQAVLPKLGLAHVFLVCPLIFIATSLPLSPSGFGIGEAAAALLFSGYSVESGATIMLLFRFWNMIMRLPGGVFFVWDRSTKNKDSLPETNTNGKSHGTKPYC